MLPVIVTGTVGVHPTHHPLPLVCARAWKVGLKDSEIPSPRLVFDRCSFSVTTSTTTLTTTTTTERRHQEPVLLPSIVCNFLCAVVVVRRPSFVVRRSSFVVRRSSFVVRRSFVVVRLSLFVCRCSSFVLRPSSFVVSLVRRVAGSERHRKLVLCVSQHNKFSCVAK